MKLGWGSIVLWLGVLQPALAWEGVTVRVDRIQPLTAAQPANQKAGLFSERRFDASGAGLLEGDVSKEPKVVGNGEWRIEPMQSLPEPLLLIHHPYNARVTVLTAPGGQPVTHSLFDADLDPQYS